MKLNQLKRLDEMFVIGYDENNRPHNGDTVIAYKQWIWLTKYDIEPVILDDIVDKCDITGIDKGEDLDTQLFYVNFIEDKRPDILFGEIDDNYLVINSYNYRHSTASNLLKKVLHQLNLHGLKINYYSSDEYEDAEYWHSREDFLKPIENKTFYHGTSYNYLDSIMSKGLVPTGKTNFKYIEHTDKTFVTLNPEKAEFHATEAAGKNKSFPVIIELDIPDPNKLVLDYDVATTFYGRNHPLTIELGYSDISDFIDDKFRMFTRSKDDSDIMKKLHKDKGQLNTKLGIFGYTGRIPASSIKSIMIDTDAFFDYIYFEEIGEHDNYKLSPVHNWNRYTKKELEKYVEEIQNRYTEDMEEDENQEY